MVGWLLVFATVAIAWLALALIDLRYRRHWEQLSVEARLARAAEATTAARATLAKLRSDRDTGQLVINDTYIPVFDRLTAQGAGEAGPDSSHHA